MQNQGQKLFAAAILGLSLVAAPALAERPDHAGKGGGKHSEWQGERSEKGAKPGKDNGKWEGHAERGRSDDRREGGDRRSSHGIHFQPETRLVVRDYYAGEFRSGHCPPGLAKKRNGCLPPGQAKKWRIGQPLPRGLVYYDLPDALILKLGKPPASHRYVRVAADILLIAVGTSMVVDAIEDLGNL